MTLTPEQWEICSSVIGHTGESECRWIAATSKECSSWTEIGVYAGRTALAAAFAIPVGAYLQLVDIRFHLDFPKTLSIILRTRPDIRISVHQDDSKCAAEYMRPTEGVFIDGGHDLATVYRDIESWQHKCTILCGHDYHPNFPGVVEAVDTLIPRRTLHGNTIWKRERVIA